MLRRTSLGLGLGCALVLVAIAGCGGGGSGDDGDDTPGVDAAIDAPAIDASAIPALRHRVNMHDLPLAARAVALMGADGAKNCDRCHALSRSRLRSWQSETDVALAACFTNLAPTTQAQARTIVDCLRENTADATSDWTPVRLGVYATAVDLDWFAYVFDLAYGADPMAVLVEHRVLGMHLDQLGLLVDHQDRLREQASSA